MSFQNFWKTLHQFRMEHEHQEQTNVGEVLRRAKNPTCRISPVITSNFLIGLKQKQMASCPCLGNNVMENLIGNIIHYIIILLVVEKEVFLII